MSLNARSLATLGLGFGALAIVTLGFTQAEAASQLHQGGPDAYGGGGARQYIDDLHPQHLRALTLVEADAHATPQVAPAPAPTPPPDQARPKETRVASLLASELLYDQAKDVPDPAEARRRADEEALILILTQLL